MRFCRISKVSRDVLVGRVGRVRRDGSVNRNGMASTAGGGMFRLY